VRRIRASKRSYLRSMNSLRSCARRVAVCQDLRARRRGKPNCLHLPMTINDKTGPPQKVAVCQDRLGMANRTASWSAVARRSRDTAIALTKASSQPAHHRPPPQLRISLFVAPRHHSAPQIARGQTHSKTLCAIPASRERASVLDCGGPPPLFPFRTG